MSGQWRRRSGATSSEVARWQLERASQAELSEREVLEALERVEAAKATLEALTARLERRLPVRRPDASSDHR